MCLIPRKEPEPSGDEPCSLLELVFTCLGHYHQYEATGEVEEGISVVEKGDVLSFQKDGPFVEGEENPPTMS
jgi:hypothetical protein